MHAEEYLPLVNENGEVIGKADRRTCHSKTFLLHPVVHLHVLNSKGQLYLQKRSMNKDVQPGKWDTAVGGHIDFGEDTESALLREAREELSLSNLKPVFALRYKFTSAIESELVYVYYTVYNGDIYPDKTEIEEGRFWYMEEIYQQLDKGIFTPNFEQEFLRIISENLIPGLTRHR